MTATTTTVPKAAMPDRARHMRIQAVARLCEIADVDYDPATVVARPHYIPVVIREAMCAARLPANSGPLTTCGHCGRPSGGGFDPDLLDEVAAVAAVAGGRTWAVMDALHDGLPARPPAGHDAASLLAALDSWTAT